METFPMAMTRGRHGGCQQRRTSGIKRFLRPVKHAGLERAHWRDAERFPRLCEPALNDAALQRTASELEAE